MPPPGIEPATTCFPACPSNHAIGTVNDMLFQLLQFLFTLRYCKNSVWCARDIVENKNKWTLLTYRFVSGVWKEITRSLWSGYMFIMKQNNVLWPWLGSNPPPPPFKPIVDALTFLVKAILSSLVFMPFSQGQTQSCSRHVCKFLAKVIFFTCATFITGTNILCGGIVNHDLDSSSQLRCQSRCKFPP